MRIKNETRSIFENMEFTVSIFFRNFRCILMTKSITIKVFHSWFAFIKKHILVSYNPLPLSLQMHNYTIEYTSKLCLPSAGMSSSILWTSFSECVNVPLVELWFVPARTWAHLRVVSCRWNREAHNVFLQYRKKLITRQNKIRLNIIQENIQTT